MTTQPLAPFRLPACTGKNKKWSFYGQAEIHGLRFTPGIYKDEQGRIRLLRVDSGMVREEVVGEFESTDFRKVRSEYWSQTQRLNVYALVDAPAN